MSGLTRAVAATGAAFVLLASACGGGDDEPSVADLIDAAGESGGDVGEPTDAGDDASGDIGDAASGGIGSVEVLDGVTATAEPGFAVVEVDGQRIEYPIAGAINVRCDVSPDLVAVNIQTPEGQSFLLQASTNTGDMLGSMTAALADADVQYGSSLVGGVLGVGDGAVSYEGPMSKVVDRDIMNAEDLPGTLAVNCGSPGGDPTATVDGQSFTFPISGAQSFDCTVTPEQFEVRVNRLAIDDLQLTMEGRFDGTRWIGAVTVFTADGNLTGVLPEAGEGLVIDGSSVTFEGAFTTPDGAEVTGSAQATC